VAYLPRDIRARAVGGLRGRVLEVGSGSGPNFPYYRGVNRVVAVEPDPTMRRRAARQVHLLRQQGVRTPIEIVDGRGEQLPFAARSFDAAVLTLVLCSVDDVDAALAEVRRVLRPGASVRMVEHVRAPDPTTAAVQAWMTRLNRRFGGCHLDRDAVGALRWAGFEILDYTEHWNGVLVDVRARTPTASARPLTPPRRLSTQAARGPVVVPAEAPQEGGRSDHSADPVAAPKVARPRPRWRASWGWMMAGALVVLGGVAVAPRLLVAPTVASIGCVPPTRTVPPLHQHLTIEEAGRLVPVPGGIGDATGRPLVSCLYWLHTHAPDGIIHIESPARRTYTLGQFFAVWRQPLGRTQVLGLRVDATHRLRTYVDGRLYRGDPRAATDAARAYHPGGRSALDATAALHVPIGPQHDTGAGRTGAGAPLSSVGRVASHRHEHRSCMVWRL